MPNNYDLVIRGGTVVTGTSETLADVAVQGETIAAIGPNIDAAGDTEIDGTGRLVLPGVIDAHTHPVYADDMEATCRAGAAAGVTTLLSFVGAIPSWGFPKSTTVEVVTSFLEQWNGKVACDFGLHAAFDAADDVAGQVPQLVEMGVASFKFFMAYRARNMMVDDRSIIQGMEAVAKNGGIALVHAENGDGIEYMESKAWDDEYVEHAAFLHCHTPLFETEATLRAIALADAVHCPLYIPHLAVAEGVAAIDIGRRASSAPVWVETCPHYLVLTNREVLRRGALSKIAPPIRLDRDNAALWSAVASGAIQTIATDHAGRTLEMKNNAKNLLQAPYGAEGIEHLLPVVYSEGVGRGRISLQRMVQVLAENPADIFGLSPRKGRLMPGADADLVIFDPTATDVCSAKNHRGNSDYCLYEGQEVTGRVTHTFRRGAAVFADGEFTDAVRGGRYQHRATFRREADSQISPQRRSVPALT